jgi:hypothetical protein
LLVSLLLGEIAVGYSHTIHRTSNSSNEPLFPQFSLFSCSFLSLDLPRSHKHTGKPQR